MGMITLVRKHPYIEKNPSHYKDCLSKYGGLHYKDKTVVGPSYLFNGNPYTSKMTPLYWDGPQVLILTNYTHGIYSYVRLTHAGI